MRSVVATLVLFATSADCFAPPLSRYDYGFDANGNRTSQLEQRTDVATQALKLPESTTYGFDDDDRLVGVKYVDTGALYRLDAVGNRTGERRALASNITALTVAAFAALSPANLTHDISSAFTRADWLASQTDAKDSTRNVALAYDLNGNTTTKTTAANTRTFAWDCRDTLVSVADNGVDLGRYDYDRNLQRVKRVAGAERVEYVLDDKYVLQEGDGSQSSRPATRRYHYASQPLAVSDGALTKYLNVDALGSVADATSTTGVLASVRQYNAWGEYRNNTAPSPSEPKLGYTGHQFDMESGLVYARARYYDPALGVFLSRDSVEGSLNDAPSLHRFAYVRQNPIRFTDFSGNFSKELEERIRAAGGRVAALNAGAAQMPTGADVAQLAAISHARDAEQQVFSTQTGTPEHEQALRRANVAYSELQGANSVNDFNRSVGYPIAMAGLGAAVSGPVAAVSTPLRLGFAFLGGFGVGETIEGTTTSLSPSTFGETAPLRGDDRLWHGVGSVSALLGSVAGEVRFGSGRTAATQLSVTESWSGFVELLPEPRGQVNLAPWRSGGGGSRVNRVSAGGEMAADPATSSAKLRLEMNRVRGEAGENMSHAESLAAGETTLGEQVTFKLPSGRRTRSDRVTQTPDELLKIREAKTGKSELTTGQMEMQDVVRTGGTVEPRGKNAQRAGLEHGIPIRVDQFEVDRY